MPHASNLAQDFGGLTSGITQDVALRLEKLCGVPWQFWLERQHLHELERITAAKPRRVLPRILSRCTSYECHRSALEHDMPVEPTDMASTGIERPR